MQPSPKLTNLVKMLCAKHEIDWQQEGVCLHLEKPDVEHYLGVENLGKERISVGLYIDFEGHIVPEIEIVLWFGFQPIAPNDDESDTHAWAAIEQTTIDDGWKLYVQLDDNREVAACLNPAGQTKLTLMAEDWADELLRMGWLDEACQSVASKRQLTPNVLWERDIEYITAPLDDEDELAFFTDLQWDDDEVDSLPADEAFAVEIDADLEFVPF